MGLLDTIKEKLEAREDEKEARLRNEEWVKAENERVRLEDAALKRVERGKEIAKAQGVSDELKAKWIKRADEKYEQDKLTSVQKLARSTPVKVINKTVDTAGSGIKETLRKNFAPTKQERDDAMEERIHRAEQAKRLRDLQPKPERQPGRPKSTAKELRDLPRTRPRSYGGGFDINVGNMLGGITPQRGAHPDPFGALRSDRPRTTKVAGNPRMGNFADPFAMMSLQTGTPKKTAPIPAKKPKKKEKDIVIKISRNPMIKGLGKMVGVPQSKGYKPKGKNPFDF